MKQELSGIDLHFLIKELKKIETGITGKAYSSGKKQIFLQIYEKDQGKKFLTYTHPFLFLSNKKIPGKLSNFAEFLRKYYERAKILSIKQIGSERIIELTIEKKQKAKIYFELFGQGNIIICDEHNSILYPLEVQEWPDRKIKKGEKYDWFEKEKNFFESTEKDFRSIEIKENISKTLAISFNLGGLFAEELCLRTGINPKSEEVNQKEKKKLFSEFTKLLKEDLNPQIVIKNNTVKDITPIKLLKYSQLENKPADSFSEALEKELLVIPEQKPEENKKVKQLQNRIELQEKTLQEYKKKIEENNKKAEQIYNNYEKIEQLIEKSKQALKTGEKITGVELDKKNKTIIADI